MFLFQEAASAAASHGWMSDPKFWLLAGGSAIALIMWFARLEFKTNANEKRQAEHEESMAEQRKDDRLEFKDVKRDLYEHKGDTNVHHNEARFREFEKGIDRRFTGVENTLQDINRKIDNRLPPSVHTTQS